MGEWWELRKGFKVLQEIDYLILNKCCNFDWGVHVMGMFGGNFRRYKEV